MKQIRGTHTNILSYFHRLGRVAVAPKEQGECFDGKRNFTRSDAFIVSWKAPWAMKEHVLQKILKIKDKNG
jgi:hypothetical protein